MSKSRLIAEWERQSRLCRGCGQPLDLPEAEEDALGGLYHPQCLCLPEEEDVVEIILEEDIEDEESEEAL